MSFPLNDCGPGNVTTYFILQCTLNVIVIFFILSIKYYDYDYDYDYYYYYVLGTVQPDVGLIEKSWRAKVS